LVVVLSQIDRNLLQRCVTRKPRAWEDFVDRFLGLVVHVVNHTAQTKNVTLTKEDSEDLAADVFFAIVSNDFAVLRKFRGESSLATYLTVVSRRVVVREMLKRQAPALTDVATEPSSNGQHAVEKRIEDKEEVDRLLEGLAGTEADVVRLFHLEGKSYAEISAATGLAENSIGPTLSRAREKMRKAAAG